MSQGRQPDKHGRNVEVPAETVATLVMIFGVLRDDELGNLRAKADEETRKRTALDAEIRAHGASVEALTKEAEIAKKRIADLAQEVTVERQRANRAEKCAQDIEDDLAKVRKFFGDKQYDEALRK